MSEREDIQRMAYVGCLYWAIGDPDVMQAFSRDTGTYVVTRRNAPATPLDKLIDDALTNNAEIVRKFIPWFNERIWGEPPPAGALVEQENTQHGHGPKDEMRHIHYHVPGDGHTHEGSR